MLSPSLSRVQPAASTVAPGGVLAHRSIPLGTPSASLSPGQPNSSTCAPAGVAAQRSRLFRTPSASLSGMGLLPSMKLRPTFSPKFEKLTSDVSVTPPSSLTVVPLFGYTAASARSRINELRGKRTPAPATKVVVVPQILPTNSVFCWHSSPPGPYSGAPDPGLEVCPGARSQQQVVQQRSGAQLDIDAVGLGQRSFHLRRKVERQPDAEPAQPAEGALQTGVVTVGLERRGTAQSRRDTCAPAPAARMRRISEQTPRLLPAAAVERGLRGPMVGEHGSNRYAPGRADKEFRHSHSVPLASSHGATTIRPRRYASHAKAQLQ